MTIGISTRLANFLGQGGSYKRAFTGGRAYLYSGTQPTSADAAPTGTLLAILTQGGGAYTAEVLSRGSVTLAGSGGQVTQITVTPTGGSAINLLLAAITYNASLTQTAADVATAINTNETMPNFYATSVGAKIIIEAMPGTGTTPNTWAVATTIATMTKTDVAMGSEVAGVASANGLLFGSCVANLLGVSGSWQGDGITNGTAGYIRLIGSIVDDFSADSANMKFIRMDATVGTTAAADIIMNTVTVSTGIPFTINGGGITIPLS